MQLFLDALHNTSYSNWSIQTCPIIDFFISSATGQLLLVQLNTISTSQPQTTIIATVVWALFPFSVWRTQLPSTLPRSSAYRPCDTFHYLPLFFADVVKRAADSAPSNSEELSAKHVTA